MATRDEIAAHLRVFADLGVHGISRDAAWRVRQNAARVQPDEPVATDVVETPESAAASVVAGMPGIVGEPAEPVATHIPVPLATSLPALRDEIGDCTRCPLHLLGRRQVVFGVGNPSADLMFVGEAPGADEDEQGVPFIGRAGQLLTKIIEAIHLTRDDVYIANVIKCRPPGNRNPEPVEVETCSPFLLRQIDLVQPKVIVALGTFAAHMLLGSDAPISRLRGRLHDYRGDIKLMPTFHPAYLLRSPDKKRDVWEDMKIVRALLSESH